jgi:hypothetical protein
VLACLFLAAGVVHVAAQTPPVPEKHNDPGAIPIGSSQVRLYGFLRADGIFDDALPNAAQGPQYIRSEDPRAGGPVGNNFTLHPRLTRFGGDLLASSARPWGARIDGKVEIDFDGGGSESRQFLRMRHAYLRANWSHASLLIGQTWDIISPLFPTVNTATLMWNAGNLGDRRPQVRMTYVSSPIGDSGSGAQVTLTGGVMLNGAVSLQDLDGDDVRDGEASGWPMMQGRTGVTVPVGGTATVAIGVSAHHAREQVGAPIAGKTRFDSWSASVDYDVQVHARVGVRGEIWRGRNLNDVRGGIAQGVNASTAREVESRGGWIELRTRVARRLVMYPGYSVDDPVDGDVGSGGRVENRVL